MVKFRHLEAFERIQGGPKNGTKFLYANNFIKY